MKYIGYVEQYDSLLRKRYGIGWHPEVIRMELNTSIGNYMIKFDSGAQELAPFIYTEETLIPEQWR